MAGRNWYKTLVKWLLEYGFVQCESDPCYLKLIRDGKCLHIVVWVDKVISFCDSDALYAEYATAFFVKFKGTDFGTDLHEWNSMRITQKSGEVKLDMQRYIEDMIADAFPGGIHYKYVTPAEPDLTKVIYDASVQKDTTHANTALAKRYRRLVMQLLYCSTMTRPDIALAVGLLTRVQAWPSPDLLKRAERVAIYLAGTADLTLRYTRTEEKSTMSWAPRAKAVTDTEGFSDSDFAKAHSTSAYIFRLAMAAISWVVKKQESIALSSFQAEITAGSLAACDAVFLRRILAFAGHEQLYPTTIFIDNESAIDVSKDPKHFAKSKHIDRRDLFIRELVERKIVAPKYIPTAKNIADALTKPLPKDVFTAHRASIMGHN